MFILLLLFSLYFSTDIDAIAYQQFIESPRKASSATQSFTLKRKTILGRATFTDLQIEVSKYLIIITLIDNATQAIMRIGIPFTTSSTNKVSNCFDQIIFYRIPENKEIMLNIFNRAFEKFLRKELEDIASHLIPSDTEHQFDAVSLPEASKSPLVSIEAALFAETDLDLRRNLSFDSDDTPLPPPTNNSIDHSLNITTAYKKLPEDGPSTASPLSPFSSKSPTTRTQSCCIIQ